MSPLLSQCEKWREVEVPHQDTQGRAWSSEECAMHASSLAELPHNECELNPDLEGRG